MYQQVSSNNVSTINVLVVNFGTLLVDDTLLVNFCYIIG